MNKIERISAILVRLQSHTVIPAREIAERFGVSLRTVYRDIRVLEEAGIPIAGEAGQGYSLVEGFKLPPLMFTTEEAIAFLLAEKLISHQTDTETYGIYRSGMDKIRAVLRRVEKDILEDIDHYVQVVDEHSAPPPPPVPVLQPLLRCLREKRSARIEYLANYNREITIREIEPLGLFFVDKWYISAWCRLRKDYRTFNLALIRNLTVGEKGFEKEHPDLSTLIKQIFAREEVYTVKLNIKKSALACNNFSKYKNGLYKEEETAESYIQYYLTHSLHQFARWYLTFADQATILDPPELKAILQSLLSKINL
jgi:predicted DNA-binding transcriptional regulator YafY